MLHHSVAPDIVCWALSDQRATRGHPGEDSRVGGSRGARGRWLTLLPLVFLWALACVSTQSAFAGSSLYWSAPSVIDTHTVNSLSCPSTALCVGVDYAGDVVTSTDPTGGSSAWTVAKIDNEPEAPYTEPNLLNDVSCPQPAGSLCIAVGVSGIFTSSDPTGGASAWTLVSGIGGHVHAVSCPSASLCVVSYGSNGEIVTSTDPTGGAGAWKVAQVDGVNSIAGLSCPSESLCVGMDEAGNVLTSTNPTGGIGNWTITHVGVGAFSSLSCTSVSFCITVGGSSVMSSTDPTGGASAWRLQKEVFPQEISFGRVACASPSLCIVAGSNGNVAESTDPTGGAGAWVGTGDLDGTNSMSGAACASESLCFLTDEAVVIGIPANTLSVSLTGLGTVTSTPSACPFGCTYSGPVCPRNCEGRFSNAFVAQRLGGISCLENGWFGGVNWGTCSLSFPAENTVTLTATPDSGSTFTGWSGACSGSLSCNVMMGADRSVSATFTPSNVSTPTRSVLTPPRLTGVHESAKRWRERGAVARSSTSTSKEKLPVGTTFSFDLSEPANVMFSFTKAADGRKVGKACIAQTKANKAKRDCTRPVVLGTLTLSARVGANKLSFDGLLTRRKKLVPGNYALLLTATASGEYSTPSTLHFTIANG